MKINPRYVIYHDLIGFNVYARNKSRSHDSQFIDIGTVIDESKNMLITEKKNQVKKYIKKDHIFQILIEDDEGTYKLEVNGQKIVGRPENRLRSLRKKRR
jgi:RNase P/RNase MRP subunit p29